MRQRTQRTQRTQREKPTQKLRVLFVVSEMVPLAKTGGLAEVAGSLPKAIAKLGHDVRVILPKYKPIIDGNWKVKRQIERLRVKVDGTYVCALERCYAIPRLPVYLLDHPDFYDRERLYGYPDEHLRFAFLCRAALESIKAIGWKPHIIHCHDWQTGLIPAYLKTIYTNDPFFAGTATVFTIHNLAYQGLFPADVLPQLGLPSEVFNMYGIEFWGKVGFLKAGLYYADLLNTVSKEYAKEIQTDECGEGLQGLLQSRKETLFGILNGIDYEKWNPKTDPYLVINYDASSPEHKLQNKLALQAKMNMPQSERTPLIGTVSRLAPQKGFDIVHDIAEELMKRDLQLVVLGAGEERYHRLFEDLDARFPHKTGIRLGVFDEELAHQIYAGADMFLMPSRFEPCGLGQMIALAYGTIPIVRKTGGLADTITEFDPKTGNGNGFAFEDYTGKALLAAIDRALSVYAQPAQWQRLMQNAFACDFSWTRSAKEYVNLYRKAISLKQSPVTSRQ